MPETKKAPKESKPRQAKSAKAEISAEKTEQVKNKDFNISLEEMTQAGLHLGHRTSRVNPKMKPYLYGIRNSVHIINLEKTAERLKEALEFVSKIIADGKTVLFVGTKIQVKDLIKNTAEECGMPYVNERWLGGTFTNFDVIKRRIDYFKDLERQKVAGELEKYTKKERLNMDKELVSLETKFTGIKNLLSLPEAIFVADMRKDDIAVKEARIKKIKIVGICDTNSDPTFADFPIPANDDAISSVRYVLDKVKEAVLKSKPKVKSAEDQTAQK